MDILLFGDQTADQYDVLRKVCLQRGTPILSAFLERVSLVLREEVQSLPRQDRALIPDFLTVNDLVEAYYHGQSKIPQLESCFVTLAQLAHYFSCNEEVQNDLPIPSNRRIVALCTGALAGIAVAVSSTPTELLPCATEAVRVAFRIGTCVGTIGGLLHQDGKNLRSWSTIVTNVSKEDARRILDAHHKSQSVPSSNQAYISAISTMAITVSGPPSTTSKLFSQKDVFSNSQRVSIPIYAPYHAKHLYTLADVEHILEGRPKTVYSATKPRSLVHSASTGQCYSKSNGFDLLFSAVLEILTEPVRWVNLLEDLVSEIVSTGKTECSLASFGVTNVANSLASAFKAGGMSTVHMSDHTSITLSGTSHGRTQNDKIAIVGMAGRFPNAASHEKLWELLEKGLDVHREIPSDRFDAQAHYDPSGKGKNKSHTPYGCFIDEPGLFDPRFFNMSPREAAQTDPMGRLALVTAYEALEMSGYVPNRTPSSKLHRIGTFYGQTSDDWREINAAENVDTYFITGGVRAFAPGRINYYFKFSGPSYSIDTACSSSLAAIQLACTSLWAGDCDTACAGGLNVLTNPDIFSGLSKGQFLSKTGGCKTYDNDADGYCRGDGCGTVILKRYEDAIADKDNILGCILGAATNHSAEAVSITHPHAGAQEYLYKKVLANAGVDAHEISYVEMHGTGTQAGDGIEMTSVTDAFAPRNRQRRPEQTLHLGAIKANIGHGEAASGINSLIKVLMMLKKDAIPANVGIKGVMNKGFPKDLLQRNVHIETRQIPYPRKGAEKRRLFLNNFSAAGGNTAIVLEDGPLRQAPVVTDLRSSHIVTVTARSIASLKRNIQNLITYLDENRSTTLPSLSYTTTARRIQHNYRVFFTVSDICQVRDALQGQLKDTYSPIAMVPTKVAFSFTGQGSQYTSVAGKLYEELPSFTADIDQLDGLVKLHGFPSILALIDGTDAATLSPIVVQLGLSCIQVALARMWAAWGVIPSLAIGHSLGEYAALHIAGVISASDMVFLAGHRAQLLESTCTANTHGMLAVKGNVERISTCLGSQMTEVACVNGPEETVLCGMIDAIESAHTGLTQMGFKATKLNVPFAFHSAQVEPILSAFTSLAASVEFNKPQIPILSPLTGEVITEAGIIGPEYLTRHARETVNFWAAVDKGSNRKLFDEKTVWLEIGAHPVCTGMIKSALGPSAITAYSLRRGEDPWKSLSSSIGALFLAGGSFNFNEYHRAFNNAHELLTLPTYSFDEKKYWLDYHNNWTLTKGEVSKTDLTQPVATLSSESKSLSTSCQKIVSEELHANSGTIVIHSDLAQPQLHVAVSGHMVNGAALCPSSLYADMGMTAADYLYKQLRPGASDVVYNFCDMEVFKPLIATLPPPAEGQHIRLEAKADLETSRVHLKFRSVTPGGKTISEHATGLVKYEAIGDWKADWHRTQYMVQTQIDILQQKLQNGSAHKILRGMAYKLFQSLVTYDSRYRGMEEVIMDGKETEATSVVKFQTKPEDGSFYCAPYWIDSLAHISGFIVNGTDLVDSANEVYISHGWKEVKISKKLSADATYRTYVRMQPVPGNVRQGDVYIFEGDEIIGVVTGLKFQCIPRRVLDIMVPPMKKVPTKTPLATTKAVSRQPFTAQSLNVKSDGFNQSARATAAAMLVVQKNKVSKLVEKAVKFKESTITERVMKIIASETDVDMSELVAEAAFENLGVDSLMSLTISAKFREDLDMDISSTLFTDYPTVGDMRKYFGQFDGDVPFEADDSSETESDSAIPLSPFEDDTSGTPPSSVPSSACSDSGKDFLDVAPMKSRTQEITTSQVTVATGPSLARVIIAEEMGVAPTDIADQADLAELGMDSLMSLAIMGSLREQTGIDLPSTFLVTNNTIEDIENALGMRPKVMARQVQATIRQSTIRPAPIRSVEVSKRLPHPRPDITGLPPATSVLLQGNAKIATRKFFLLPDGSGSATSYVSIPNLSPDLAVFGLNCPFMKTPEDFNCGVEAIAALYLNEIKRRQPEGPYLLGGWSAGGVIAYETAMQVVHSGDKVERLVLIDSPCPVDLDPLPARLHIFFDSIGLLGTGKPGGTPGWLLPHFSASIKALKDYQPKPMPAELAPQVCAIWCTDGVCPNPDDPRPPPAEDEDPAPMKWLLNNRTDFAHNGWAQLIPEANFEYAVMGGNHFTMMKNHLAITLGQHIAKGLRL